MRVFSGKFVDPVQAEVIEGKLVTENGRILELGHRVPNGAEHVQLEGFVTPGLIDAHIHLCLDGSNDPVTSYSGTTMTERVVRAASFLRDHLRAGTTTVRDMGGPHEVTIHLRNAVNKGVLSGPRIWASGHNLTITGGHGWMFGTEADGMDGVRRAARTELKAGADGVKFMATGGVLTPGVIPGSVAFTVPELRAGIDEAHKVSKRTAAHAQSLAGIRNALEAGIDTIEHGAFDHWDNETLALMRDRGVILCATLAPRLFMIDGPGRDTMPAWLVEKADHATRNHAQNVLEAYRAGVMVCAGTDAGVPHVRHGALPHELEGLARLGLGLPDVLRAATTFAARALGWDDIGSFRPGAHADLAVLATNPLEDAGAYHRVTRTIKSAEIVA